VDPNGYRRVGRTLNAAAESADAQMTLFHHNMGELMYFAPGWDSIDPVGLVDAWVAQNGFSVDHVFKRRPDLLILPSKDRGKITSYQAELFPDISLSVWGDPRARDFIYLGYYPHMVFGAEGAMHFFLRKSRVEDYPWLGDFIVESLELARIETFWDP
jgi:hypothetical protein